MSDPTNIHATTIVIGTKGLIFVGPPGSGKSTLAFACLTSAQNQGMFSALVADDQVFVRQLGSHILAEAPPAIFGKIEIRASGIAQIGARSSTLLDLCIQPVNSESAPRLPTDSLLEIAPGLFLPSLSIPVSAAASALAIVAALHQFQTG